MPDLKFFYNQRVDLIDKADLLKQVGHSVHGKAISGVDYDQIIEDICGGLALVDNDTLLDLCCGNGVITQAFSDHCQQISGIDVSDKMIDLAKENNQQQHVNFINGDVMRLPEFFTEKRFSKVMMFGSLQHFHPSQFEHLMNTIKSVCFDDFSVFFGFVTDHAFKWHFYDTWQKKAQHLYRRVVNMEYMGYWWQKKDIEKVCESMRLSCRFVNLMPGQYGYPFRFHAVISHQESR